MENIMKKMIRPQRATPGYQKVFRCISPLYPLRENVQRIYTRYTESQPCIEANIRPLSMRNLVIVKTKQLNIKN